MLPYFEAPKGNSETEIDKALSAIIHERKDQKIDRLIDILQRNFSRTVIWGNVGGQTGEKMVRAAFAPMIKFSNLSSDF